MSGDDAIRETYEWHFLMQHVRPFSTPFLNRLLRERIDEESAARSDFLENLRAAALHAIEKDDVVATRRALHVLAYVGQNDDISKLHRLMEHDDPGVVRDARTCLFEIQHA